MGNGDVVESSVLERCLKVLFKIGTWAVEKKRDPARVLRYVQRIIESEDFDSILDAPRPSPSAPVPTPRVQDPFAVRDWRAEMKRFYKKVFGLKVDFSQVSISDDPGGFGWELFVPKGMTLNLAWAKCCERFPSSSDYGNDHDTMVHANERTAVESYGRRFRPRVEADEENMNLSANALSERGGGNITLLERFLLELWYHWKTGKHLDIQCVTLCAGSRTRFGLVPVTYWDVGRFQVWRYNTGVYRGSLRSRSAV